MAKNVVHGVGGGQRKAQDTAEQSQRRGVVLVAARSEKAKDHTIGREPPHKVSA